MAGHIKGRSVLIMVEKDGEYIPVAGQREGNLSRTVDEMDVSSKDSDTRETELTFLNWEISCGGLVKLADEGFALLEEAFNNKEKVKVQFNLPEITYTGEAYITELSFDAPYEDVVTYSATLKGSSELTKADVTQA